MAELDSNNQAHVSVFMFLTTNGQTVRDFKEVGGQTMEDLTFFNSATSSGLQKSNAALLSHMLVEFINKYYTQQREDKYANSSIIDLVGAFSGILIDRTKEVHDLASLADNIFQYKNEQSAAVPLSSLGAKIG